MRKVLVSFSAFIILCAFCACSTGGSSDSDAANQVTLKINSVGINVNEAGVPRSPFFDTDVPPTGFSVTPRWLPHYISANAPEYLKITLLRIEVQGSDELWQPIWEGQEELTIQGATVVMDGVNANVKPIPPGLIKTVRVEFKSFGKVKGSVTDNFIIDPSDFTKGEKRTYYTRAGYFYNAVTRSGGADSDEVFLNGPAEEIEISLSGDRDTFSLTYPVNKEFAAGATPTFTMLFDLNMVLRFYNGRRNDGLGQPNPPDPKNKAFFFAHSITVDDSSFIGGFLGEVGSIDGYKKYTLIYPSDNHENVAAIMGWLTLVYDANGEFVAGQTFGDDDNGLASGKGKIIKYEKVGSSANLTDKIFGTTLYGFNRLTSIGEQSSPLVYVPSTTHLLNYEGEVIVKLLLKQ